MEYISICHERCYLIGVEQETLAHREIRECQVMDPENGKFVKVSIYMKNSLLYFFRFLHCV